MKVANHTITASYSGNTNVPASGGSLTQTVCLGATNTALSDSMLNGSVTFTATVTTAVPNTGVPSGKVTLMAGTNIKLGTVTLTSSGVATFPAVIASKVAGQTITASYSGNKFFTASGTNLLMTASPLATTMAVASSANTSVYGAPITFTATVSAPGGVTPTGTVTFLDGGTPLGSGTLNDQGIASFSTSALTLPLTLGSHTITASYAGTSAFGASSSTLCRRSAHRLRPPWEAPWPIRRHSVR